MDKLSRNDGISSVYRRLAKSQKTGHGSSAYLRYVNRPMGRLFAAVSFRCGLTPDQVTLAGGATTYVACLLVAFLGEIPLVAFTSSVLLVLGYALDSADGQLARLTGSEGFRGEFLDRIIDTGKIVLIHAAFLGLMIRDSGRSDDLLLVVPIVAIFASSVLSFAAVLRKELYNRAGTSVNAIAGDSGGRLKSVIYLVKEYGVLCILVAVAPWPNVWVPFYCAITLASLLLCVAFVAKWSSELARLRSS